MITDGEKHHLNSLHLEKKKKILEVGEPPKVLG